MLGKIKTEGGLLRKAAGWVYYYNLVRPHFGAGMRGKAPLAKLRELGIAVSEEFALFPPLILDRISADRALNMAIPARSPKWYRALLSYERRINRLTFRLYKYNQ